MHYAHNKTTSTANSQQTPPTTFRKTIGTSKRPLKNQNYVQSSFRVTLCKHFKPIKNPLTQTNQTDHFALRPIYVQHPGL
jgi:hypothetical protein